MSPRIPSLLLGGALLNILACSSGPELPSAPTTTLVSSDTQAQTGSCNPAPPGPTISGVSATPNTLWPPNHKMRRVTIGYTATDACSCSLRVASNEPVNSIGDGNTQPDWVVLDSHHVQLRAERQGPGSGRVYTITITCTDGRNTTTATTTVRVPHDQGR